VAQPKKKAPEYLYFGAFSGTRKKFQVSLFTAFIYLSFSDAAYGLKAFYAYAFSFFLFFF